MKFSTFVRTSLITASMVVSYLAVPTSSLAYDGRCCYDPSAGETGCSTGETCYTDREVKNDCTGNGVDTAGGCHQCTSPKVATACGGGSTGPSAATCTQYVYALENPTNMTVGQVKDFYADGHANIGNFAKMVASVTNVPLGGLAVATVATTSGPTCYSTNGNCRQGFRLTARNNGTALVKVTTQVKLCPACAISGNCSQTYTLNVGAVTPLACKPGAKCASSSRDGAFVAGSSITCSMPVLTTTELNGGRAGYFVRCTPYKGTVAQTVIAKSSVTGTFAPFTQATGVTNIKCSFRHCVTGTDSVTKCTDWGAAS